MNNSLQLPLDLLRTFVAAADSRSFTRAGKAVSRTQSAVSMQVKRLEDLAGQPLFARGGRDVALTPEGEALLPYARRILRLHDEAVSALARPEMAGLVRLGSPDDFAARFLPPILARFAQTFPRVQVYVRTEPSSRLLADLGRGELDLVIATLPDLARGGELIAREPVVWATSARHLAHEQEPLPLAVFHKGCFYRQWAEQALDTAGRDYRVAYVSPSIAGLQAAMFAGLAVAPIGLSTVPEGARLLTAEEGFPPLPTASITLHRRLDGRTPAVDGLAEHVAEAFRENQAVLP